MHLYLIFKKFIRPFLRRCHHLPLCLTPLCYRGLPTNLALQSRYFIGSTERTVTTMYIFVVILPANVIVNFFSRAARNPWTHAVAAVLVPVHRMALQITLPTTNTFHSLFVLHCRLIHIMCCPCISRFARGWTIPVFSPQVTSFAQKGNKDLQIVLVLNSCNLVLYNK